MTHSKIIYGDGSTEQGTFEDIPHARIHAREQARSHGTYVRGQTCWHGDEYQCLTHSGRGVKEAAHSK